MTKTAKEYREHKARWPDVCRCTFEDWQERRGSHTDDEDYSQVGPDFAEVLPKDPIERKLIPLATGLLDYFPDALCAVAELSRIGNEQHNSGEPLHWSRDKSTDHADTILRHMMQRGLTDNDGVRHSTKVAWRALAQLQLEIEVNRDE